MKPQEPHRIVPLSVVTIVAFCLLVVLQLFVMAGGLEIKATTIKKVAPWAYEPFLKLVGEYPGSRASRGQARVSDAEPSSLPAEGSVAGFSLEELDISIDSALPTPTNVIIDPSMSLEEASPLPVNLESFDSDHVVPVG